MGPAFRFGGGRIEGMRQKSRSPSLCVREPRSKIARAVLRVWVVFLAGACAPAAQDRTDPEVQEGQLDLEIQEDRRDP